MLVNETLDITVIQSSHNPVKKAVSRDNVCNQSLLMGLMGQDLCASDCGTLQVKGAD